MARDFDFRMHDICNNECAGYFLIEARSKVFDRKP